MKGFMKKTALLRTHTRIPAKSKTAPQLDLHPKLFVTGYNGVDFSNSNVINKGDITFSISIMNISEDILGVSILAAKNKDLGKFSKTTNFIISSY